MASHFAGEGQWYCWNDFVLRSVSEGEVVKAHSQWKRPCIAIFTSRRVTSQLENLPLVAQQPVSTAAHLSDEFSLMAGPTQSTGVAPTFTPLMNDEIPLKLP